MVSGATFQNKTDIERRIIECGGSVVQNPGNECLLVNIPYSLMCFTMLLENLNYEK